MTAAGRPAAQPRLHRQRLSRSIEVQQAVKEIIVTRRLAAGDPLPTESELIAELGVGRNSVREALKALQAVGIVEIRHGFGMFVGRMSLAGLVDELSFHSRITLSNGRNHLAHLMEIREVLESGLVQRLIDRGPGIDLAPVDGVMAQMAAESAAGEVSPEVDRLFHDVLYRPLGNPLVGQLLGAFWDVYHQLRDDLGGPAESPAELLRLHQDIYAAVLAGDRPAATAAMHAHFAGVRARLAALSRSLPPDNTA